MRRIVAVVVALATALAIAVAASAKSDEWARLLAPLPVHPRSGATITVRWAVETRATSGKIVPFSAEGMFVKLIGLHGNATVGWASRVRERHPPKGPPYHAKVRIPVGGIARIRFGLMGFSEGIKGAHPAPVYFILRNR